MTTLELAELIAEAVLKHEGVMDAYGRIPTGAGLAVLKVLHENDSWFVRNPTGESWHEEAEERYEMIQPELFK